MDPNELPPGFYITTPSLEVHHVESGVVLRNNVLHTRLDGTKELLNTLEFFRQPNTMANLWASQAPERADVEALLEHAMIMDVGVFLEQSGSPIGDGGDVRNEVLGEGEPPDIVVFGAPTDVATSGEGGARTGPQWIRKAFQVYPWSRIGDELAGSAAASHGAGSAGDMLKASILDIDMRRCYTGRRPRVVDIGDVRYMPGEGLHTYGARIMAFTEMILARGAKPFLLGGDHSVTHFVLKAVMERFDAFGIIHFDAHHDLRLTFSPNMHFITHGNPFNAALRSDKLKVMTQIGLRTVEIIEDTAKLERDDRLRLVSGMDVQTQSPEAVFEALPRDIPYYLTFDIDCMAPDLAPETGTPVVGGLSYYQALSLVDHAARHFDLLGCDLVEVAGSPARGWNGAAAIAARLLLQLMLGKTPYQPLVSYRRRH